MFKYLLRLVIIKEVVDEGTYLILGKWNIVVIKPYLVITNESKIVAK